MEKVMGYGCIYNGKAKIGRSPSSHNEQRQKNKLERSLSIGKEMLPAAVGVTQKNGKNRSYEPSIVI